MELSQILGLYGFYSSGFMSCLLHLAFGRTGFFAGLWFVGEHIVWGVELGVLFGYTPFPSPVGFQKKQ